VHFLISEVISNATRYVVIWSAYRSIVQKLIGKNAIWLVKLASGLLLLHRERVVFYGSLPSQRSMQSSFTFFRALVKNNQSQPNSCVTYATTHKNTSKSSKKRIKHTFQAKSTTNRPKKKPNAPLAFFSKLSVSLPKPLKQKNVYKACDLNFIVDQDMKDIQQHAPRKPVLEVTSSLIHFLSTILRNLLVCLCWHSLWLLLVKPAKTAHAVSNAGLT